MKLTIGILATAMMIGGTVAPKAAAQNPDAIDNARNAVKSLQQQQASGSQAPAAKPAPGAPAPSVKPAVIPGASSSPVPAAKPVAKTVASGQHNQLQHVNVVPGSNDIQIEISASGAVTPKVSNLSSPARVLVELPETIVATAQNKIPVGSGGVKGVRIGMDGKTPPTTSVVVDLEKAIAYDLASSPADKVVLILHTQDAGATVAKNAPAPAAKAAAPVAKSSVPAPQVQAAAKPVVVANAAAPAAKTSAPVAKTSAPAPQAQTAAKAVVVANAAAPVAKTSAAVAAPQGGAKAVAAPKVADAKTPAPVAKPAAAPAAKADSKEPAKTTVVAAKPSAPVVAAEPPAKTAEAPKAPKQEDKKWAMNGKRDPFFSPVVQQSGSGCSTGKKCLEIGTINLRGVVKSDTGFIAVVTNNLGKAYFLRENDPVFNGYVVRITGDSVTFQETIQDKLGKSFTREVVKRIFTPAV